MRDFFGRRLDLHVAHDARGESRAEFGFFDFDFEAGLSDGIRQFGPERLERDVVDRRCFAGDAAVIHGVGAVGTDFHLPDGVFALAAAALDSEADSSQVFGETVIVYREVNEIAKPMWRKFHVKLSAVSFQLSATDS